MIQLPSIHKKSQRVGRSGKRGSYSGRGVKGQKSRSGHRIRPAERDLIMRIPKMRGFRNKPKDAIPEVFNLGALSVRLKSHVKGNVPLEITNDFLRAIGFVKKDFNGIVKILGTGEIAFPVIVSGVKVSESAKMKIEKAGGSVK
jgi:large subunit ribosomal protein L15